MHACIEFHINRLEGILLQFNDIDDIKLQNFTHFKRYLFITDNHVLDIRTLRQIILKVEFSIYLIHKFMSKVLSDP